MRNKSKKLLATILICMAGLSFTCVAVNNGEEKCSGIVIDGGEKTVGRGDESYKIAEKYSTDAEIYEDIQDNYYSTSIIETMINDGHLLGYVDQLKAEGWIPKDFTPAGSKSSNTSSAEAKPETPAETSNETSTSDNKQPEKTEKNNKSETKTETKKEPTQEEIDAAWEETERVEATCTEDGKIVYTNSITGDTKEESIPATGHTEGEWKVTKEAGPFSTGSKEVTCEKCGEVLGTEEIPQTCPLPLAAVIGIVVAVVAVFGIVIIVVKKRNK